jgi:hypothetical protein
VASRQQHNETDLLLLESGVKFLSVLFALLVQTPQLSDVALHHSAEHAGRMRLSFPVHESRDGTANRFRKGHVSVDQQCEVRAVIAVSNEEAVPQEEGDIRLERLSAPKRGFDGPGGVGTHQGVEQRHTVDRSRRLERNQRVTFGLQRRNGFGDSTHTATIHVYQREDKERGRRE